MKRNAIFSALLFTLITLFAADVFAIPAFARRYQISCSTCHAPFPKLKPYGDDFAGEGFIIAEEEKPRDYVSAGDDLLWLNKEFPLSVRFDAYAMYDKKSDVKTDLQSPWGLKLMSGGALYKNIGYYFYFYMSERGEVAGIEDAYIHFNNVFKTNLDIMVGQFQTSDPLMKRELRLSFEDYMIYKYKTGYTQTNLTYDRGVMLVYGIEKTGTDITALIVNGNGKNTSRNGKFDADKYKNIGLRINQSIGSFASIGGFYYTGKESQHSYYFNSVTMQDEYGFINNEITYTGPDCNIIAGPVEMTIQYLVRKDSNPWHKPNNQEKETETKGIVAEVVVSPWLDKSRIYFTGLYNNIDSEFEDYKYETAALNATYLLARNLRLMGEYIRDMENKNNNFIFGIVSGF